MQDHSRHAWRRIRHYFLTGLAAILPVALALYVADKILVFFNGLGSLLPASIRFPGLGLVLTLLVITLFGLLVSNIMGQQLVRMMDWVLGRVPVIRVVYEGSKQVLKVLFDPDANSAFRAVVLAPYPGPASLVVGFVVSDDVVPGRVGVFIPFAPPTGGVLLFYAPDDLKPAAMSVEQAMKMLLSGGMLAPSGPASSSGRTRKEQGQ